jgi:dTDP-4-dehydrorhamnose 3,5-epimerase
MVSNLLIAGVKLKPLKVIPDERGRLMEILRCDEELYEKFGQVYLTTIYPGVVKGWHYHRIQQDNIAVVKGMMKIVLYDSRHLSTTHHKINEFFIGDYNPQLIHIPPMVYHGFKCISEDMALVVNVPTEPYNYSQPDEYRLAPDGDSIPYKWDRKDG